MMVCFEQLLSFEKCYEVNYELCRCTDPGLSIFGQILLFHNVKQNETCSHRTKSYDFQNQFQNQKHIDFVNIT